MGVEGEGSWVGLVGLPGRLQQVMELLTWKSEGDGGGDGGSGGGALDMKLL